MATQSCRFSSVMKERKEGEGKDMWRVENGIERKELNGKNIT